MRSLWDFNDVYINQTNGNMTIETLDKEIRKGIRTAAVRSIPKSKSKIKRKAVPWWDENCKEAVRNRKKLNLNY